MKTLQWIVALALAATGVGVGAQTTLNVVTAGDQNMVDYITNYLGPKFEKMNPGVKVRAVGTGPADAGTQKIYEKLSAQAKAGVKEVDIDVAVVHQKGAGTMVKESLLQQYRKDISAGKLTSRDTATNALGTNVDGYVIPMFHSQIALAYMPDMVKSVPKTFTELEAWTKANPKQFGYNGVKGGMSGVGFVTGWVAAHGADASKLEKGPYDTSQKGAIDKAMGELKEFNKNVVLTPGNAGTLDMLNRGEIAMGPVWVDMFYSWQADGRMSPKVKLGLLQPGLPGQPMYYVVPKNAAHPDLAKKFIDLAASPEVQAEGIVKQFNWYPGIDPQYVQAKLDPAVWNKLFTDISPGDLSKYGRPFPLSEYFTDILEAYERVVMK